MAYYENSDIIILVSDKQDWQCTHNSKNEAHLCNHWKSKHVTYSECVSLALVTQHTMHMHCVICVLSGCNIFFHFISQMAQLQGKFIEYKMCV